MGFQSSSVYTFFGLAVGSAAKSTTAAHEEVMTTRFTVGAYAFTDLRIPRVPWIAGSMKSRFEDTAPSLSIVNMGI
jgi:hypothetical protein